MANFYTALSSHEIAGKIAELLNTCNKLKKRHNVYTIMNSNTIYFVDTIRGQVAGCIGKIKEGHHLTRILHLCVHPNFRRFGLARKLLNVAVERTDSIYAYATVRKDNTASIELFKSAGFIAVDNADVITFGKIVNQAGALHVRI
ncbi:MAG: N-acetyltransferase [Desulfobacteraceae bacterium]|jgi:ribosomal protein S18 acetylase RimI-like enzyme